MNNLVSINKPEVPSFRAAYIKEKGTRSKLDACGHKNSKFKMMWTLLTTSGMGNLNLWSHKALNFLGRCYLNYCIFQPYHQILSSVSKTSFITHMNIERGLFTHVLCCTRSYIKVNITLKKTRGVVTYTKIKRCLEELQMWPPWQMLRKKILFSYLLK